MRVLITGATGFLGYHLCRCLAQSGHKVLAWHRKRSEITRIQQLGVECTAGDLSDLAGLRRAVAGKDAVIHAAASIQYWPADPNAQQDVNVTGARNLARACKIEKVGRLLHVSSVAAIGIPEDPRHPADENSPFNLQRAPLKYHLSKKLGEDAVLEQAAGGLDAVIVNPATIFGPHGQRYRGGEMIAKVSSGFFVPYFSGGICAVHVDDVVEGCILALERGLSGNRYILGGENLSYREIARRSSDALQIRRRLIKVPSLVTAGLTLASVPLARLATSFRRFNPALHYICNRFQYYSSDKAGRAFGYAPRGFDAIVQHYLARAAGSQSCANGRQSAE